MPHFTTTSTTTSSSLSAAQQQYIWDVWNKAFIASTNLTTSSTTTIVTATNDRIWKQWNDTTKAALDHALLNLFYEQQNKAWVTWNVNYNAANVATNGIVHVNVEAVPELSAEVRQRQAAQRQYEQERRAEYERVQATHAEAKIKAEKLLQSALSDKQKEELKTKGFFHCKSRKGNLYRVYRGSHGNVKLLNSAGKEIEKLCIQPPEVPEGDCMLAQKLHIENDEDGFRQTANITKLMN